MDVLVFARYGLLVCVLLIAIYTDITQRKIYNYLTFPAIGLGLGLILGEYLLFDNLYAFKGLIFGWCVIFLIFGIPVWLGWLGAGDFKLIVAVTTILAGRQIFEIIFCISLIGAVMAILVLIWQGSILKGLGGVLKLIIKPRSASIEDDTGLTIPYGVAISLGTLLPIFLYFFNN